MRVLILYRPQNKTAIDRVAAFLRIEGFEVDISAATFPADVGRAMIQTADRVLVLWDDATQGRGSLYDCTQDAGEAGKLVVLLHGINDAPLSPRIPRFRIDLPGSYLPSFFGPIVELLRSDLPVVPRDPSPQSGMLSSGAAWGQKAGVLYQSGPKRRQPTPLELAVDVNEGLQKQIETLRARQASAEESVRKLRAEAAKKAGMENVRYSVRSRTRDEPHHTDDLRMSVRSPSAVEPGRKFMLQVWFFRFLQRALVAKRARQADGEATDRGTSALGVAARRGAELVVTIDVGGLNANETVQTLTWHGVPVSAQFQLTAPNLALKARYFPTIRVFLDGIPIAKQTVALKAEPVTIVSAKVRDNDSKNYRRAFLSYAAPDRAKVMLQAQALKAVGVQVFQDVLKLDPGQRWEQQLYNYIAKADLFMLFWSKDAAQSAWVIREAEFALHCQRTRRKDSPEIVPVILDGPPPALPPPSLNHIHFNDPVRCIMAAYGA